MKRSSALALYLGFALTGFCTALPGAVLPVLLMHWHLSDQRAGVLFLLLFLGSCAGSLLSRGDAIRLLPIGPAVMMFACATLAWVHGPLVLIVFAAYGFGFGMMIAVITRARLLQVPERGVAEVNRLNLIWGMGAVLCPSIATGIIRVSSVSALLLVLACTVLASPTFLFMLSGARRDSQLATATPIALSVPLPPVFALYAFLAVGAEAAFGAWIATYSHRLETGPFAPVEATSLFWFGLLTSRVIAGSNVSQRLGDAKLARISVVLAAIGGTVLLLAPDKTVLVLAALVAGLGLGPIFPTVLAYVLPRTSSNTIFVVGGITSSLLPWLTGAISVHTNSLRTGMAVPACATVFLLLFSPFFTRLLLRWKPVKSLSPSESARG